MNGAPGYPMARKNPCLRIETWGTRLSLASGAEVGATPANHNTFDRRSADEAGLAGAHVDAVFQLEEAADAVGVDVVGDGRPAEFYGVGEDGDERVAEAAEFSAGKQRGQTAGTDAGAEEGLVGVDVPDAVEQGLVEQRGLDGSAAFAEEGDEVFQ